RQLQQVARPAVAAGHRRQHQRDRLLSDPVGPARALQGRELGAVRRDHVGRERLNPAARSEKGKGRRAKPAAFFLAACEGSPTLVPLNDKWRKRGYEQAWFLGWRFYSCHFVSVRLSVRSKEVRRRGDRYRDQDRPLLPL